MKVVITIEAENSYDFAKLSGAFEALGKSANFQSGGSVRAAMPDAQEAIDRYFQTGGIQRTTEKVIVGDKPGPEYAVKPLYAHDAGKPIGGAPSPLPGVTEYAGAGEKEAEAEQPKTEEKKTRQTKAQKHAQAKDIVENVEAWLEGTGVSFAPNIDVSPEVQKMVYELLKAQDSEDKADAAGFINPATGSPTEQAEASQDAINNQEQELAMEKEEEAAKPEVSEDLLRRVCYALNTQGPAGKTSLAVIMKKYGASKFSEIPKDKYADVYADALPDIEQFKLTIPDAL